jgi:hypothetical protein
MNFKLQSIRAASLLLYFLLVGWDFWYCGHYWPIVPAPDDGDGDCGEIGGMKIGKENRSTRRKPDNVNFYPPQIINSLARVRPRAAAVGSQRLTA